jgi:nicotinate (nicotinamide) nucleotide adenylyltransferase
VSLRRLFILLAFFTAAVAVADPPLRIGVYSGTFDPPHKGHLGVIEAVEKSLGLDIVYVVPNPITDHKPNATSYALRKRMAQLQFAEKGIIVADPELENAAKNGQDTYEVLRKRFGPESEYFRIMGEDSFAHYLVDSSRTKEGLTLVVVSRELVQPGLPKIEVIPDKIGKSFVISIPEEKSGYSSTLARELISKGTQPDFIKQSVFDFIQENYLYGSKPQLKPIDASFKLGDRGEQAEWVRCVRGELSSP